MRFAPHKIIGGDRQRHYLLLWPPLSGIAAAVIEDRQMGKMVEIFNRAGGAMIWRR